MISRNTLRQIPPILALAFVACCGWGVASAEEIWARPGPLPSVFQAEPQHHPATLASAEAPVVQPYVPPQFDAPVYVGAQPPQAPEFGLGAFDNLTFFLGLDGSKQPQDFGINAQFGGRAAGNWGMPLWRDRGLGFQIGTAVDATGDAVQVVQRVQGSTGRTQQFTTVGFYQRTQLGVNWGIVYDFLYEDYYDYFNLGQWRGDLSYQLSPQNTIGVWTTVSDRTSTGTFGATPITLVPISQTNAYLNHTWCNRVQTMFWGGVAYNHGQVNAVLGDLPPLTNQFVFGAQLFVPLTDRLALFGQGNFIMPVGSGLVVSFFGFELSTRGGMMSSGSRFAPVQTVAAPTNFAVDLRRR